MTDLAWNLIFQTLNLSEYNFDKPFYINAKEIKEIVKIFKETKDREVRVICSQICREDRPKIFQEKNLFLLPVKNKYYVIVKGEGFVDIPDIKTESIIYKSKLDFELDSSKVGNSEMQHIDFAYASSIIRTFTEDDSLVLTIRGRKYTPEFNFNIGKNKINTLGVQTEVDAGYEGKNQIVLLEAKNSNTQNTIIRQLFYPYRQ